MTAASAAGAGCCMLVLELGLEEKSSEGESEAPDELELEVTLSLRGCWLNADGSKKSWLPIPSPNCSADGSTVGALKSKASRSIGIKLNMSTLAGFTVPGAGADGCTWASRSGSLNVESHNVLNCDQSGGLSADAELDS